MAKSIRPTFTVLSSLVLAMFLIQGCGKSSDPMNVALPDVQAPEDSNDLNLPDGSQTPAPMQPLVETDSPLLLPNEKPTTGSGEPVGQGGAAPAPQMALSKMAFNFVRGYQLPLYIQFPDTSFVAEQKANWLIGARCKVLRARMARVESKPTNLFPLVPETLCSNPILGQKAEITYVPGRYVGRRDVSVGMLSTDSTQTEVMLRKDLSVAAIREITDKPKVFGPSRHVQITVATEKLVAQSTKSKDTDRLEVRAADGSMLYIASSEKSAVLKRNVTTKTIDIRKFGHYKINAREVSKSSVLGLIGINAKDSVECQVSVLDSFGKKVDEVTVNERCFHARP